MAQEHKVNLVLSSSADLDIQKILNYTLQKWGEAQFEKYFSLLKKAFSEIQEDPNCPTCHHRNELFEGCISKRIGSHVAFYRISKGNIEIVRVLHKSMDFGLHL